MLVMEYIDGTSITDLDTICKEWNFSKTEIANMLFSALGKLIFEHGYVHGDPHAGNIFVRPHPKNKRKPQIVLLDHGLSDYLSDDFRIRYAQFWKALVLNDKEEIKKYCSHYGIDNHELYVSMILMQDYGDEDSGMLQDKEFNADVKGKDVGPVNWEGYEDIEADLLQIMEKMPQEMYLLYRCYYLLRAINIKLGAPVNRYLIMGRIASRTSSGGKVLSLFETMKFEYQLFMFSVRMFVMSLLIWLNGLFN
eukprot:TRINITY_DN2582_c0_g1_i3.p1 TRINITY_DN2582_c0_g1~~TRINITY_DN2582_c0_g1_i3.p1  ORF type:complete len:251 (+),score=45.79 TRINITY_DN2582_c0_g1_i3:149-901(+)